MTNWSVENNNTIFFVFNQQQHCVKTNVIYSNYLQIIEMYNITGPIRY